MAIVREGNNGVLVVVEADVGVMSEAWEASRIGNTWRVPVSGHGHDPGAADGREGAGAGSGGRGREGARSGHGLRA